MSLRISHSAAVQCYWCYALFLLVGALLGFGRLAASLNQPFGGFIWQYDYAEGSSVSYDTPRHWSGSVAGLVPYTRILAINGFPPRAFEQLYTSLPLGAPLIYTVIDPQGSLRLITARTERFTLGHLVEAYGLLFLGALSAAGCGAYLVKTASAANARRFGYTLLLCSALAFYHTHNGNITAFYDARIATALLWAPAPPLIGASLVHAAFVTPSAVLQPLRRRLIPATYAAASLLGLATSGALLAGFTRWGAQVQLAGAHLSIGLLFAGMLGLTIRQGMALLHAHIAGRAGQESRALSIAWLYIVLYLLGSIVAINIRWPTVFDWMSIIAVFLPFSLAYAIRNAEMVVQLEQENQLRLQLIDDLHEVHMLQDRLLSELADEIHDGVLAESKALEMRLFAAARQIQAAPGPIAALQNNMRDIHRQSVALTRSLRLLVDGAKPVDFTQERFTDALERTIAQLEQFSDVPHYELHIDSSFDQLPILTMTELYWITRAALNNVRDHARAQRCTIVGRQAGQELVLTITDDGQGEREAPEPSAASARRRFGLASMRSRAARIGGVCKVQLSPQGAQVMVQLPLSAAAYGERD